MKEHNCSIVDWVFSILVILLVVQITLNQVNHNERMKNYSDLTKNIDKNNELIESQINLMKTVELNQKILLEKLNIGE